MPEAVMSTCHDIRSQPSLPRAFCQLFSKSRLTIIPEWKIDLSQIECNHASDTTLLEMRHGVSIIRFARPFGDLSFL